MALLTLITSGCSKSRLSHSTCLCSCVTGDVVLGRFHLGGNRITQAFELCPHKERRRMHYPEVQIGNSGPILMLVMHSRLILASILLVFNSLPAYAQQSPLK